MSSHSNRFLANLPESDYDRLRLDLEYVSLKAGATLHVTGQNINHVYFPVDCMVSSLLVSNEGSEVEVQTVGAEGFVGHTAILGSREATSRALVVIGGDAWRLPVGWFREEFRRGGKLHDFALCHVSAPLAQANQLALCHRLHSVEERLCRWLLTAADVTGSAELPLTHETLAHLLGSRRPGVTIAINILRHSGLIDCSRGFVSIKNHKDACECYHLIRDAVGKSVAAMLRRAGPPNCARHLVTRQSEPPRAQSSDARLRARGLHKTVKVPDGKSDLL